TLLPCLRAKQLFQTTVSIKCIPLLRVVNRGPRKFVFFPKEARSRMHAEGPEWLGVSFSTARPRDQSTNKRVDWNRWERFGLWPRGYTCVHWNGCAIPSRIPGNRFMWFLVMTRT